MRVSRRILALTLAAGLLGSGCAGDEPAAEADPHPSQEPVPAPPGRIPRVTLQPALTGKQVPGHLVYFSWPAGRTVRREEDLSALGSRPAEVIDTAGKEVRIRLHDKVPPTRVNVMAYRNRNSSNLPVDKFMSAECVESARKVPCAYTTDAVVTIRAVMADDAEIIAVNVGWAVSREQLDANPQLPPEVSAAWAFVLKP